MNAVASSRAKHALYEFSYTPCDKRDLNPVAQ